MLWAFPGWDSLHPTVIHFPIVLLLVAPLFVLIAAVLPPPKGQPFMVSALILLAMGTASLFLAITTGEAGARFVPRGRTTDLLKLHEDLGFEARGIFVMLLVLYVSVMLVPKVLHRDGRLFSTVLPIAFLLLYCAGAVVLIKAAHEGGRLVHESGTHAALRLYSEMPKWPAGQKN